MLKGISPLVSPALLAVLCRMGHGDEIVFADAHFPGHSVHDRTLRADGLQIVPLLEGVLPLLALDTYDPAPVQMMAPVEGDTTDPAVEAAYQAVVSRFEPDIPAIQKLERFAFYERARSAYAVVMTGDTATYANIILKKGVTPS